MYKRVVAVHFSALPLDVAFASHCEGIAVIPPSRESAPRAVVQTIQGHSVVVTVSGLAREKGVRIGMGEVAARAVCAQLAVRERDASLELVHLERLADVLLAFGPSVEVCPTAFLLVELCTGADDESLVLQQIGSRLLELGYESTTVVADDIDTACTIARQKETVNRVVPRGCSAEVLAELPVEALVWTDPRTDPLSRRQAQMHGMCEALKAVGLLTVGTLQALAPTEVGERFGVEGRQLWDRSRGMNRRPLRKHVPPLVMNEDYAFEQVVDDLEPILFVIRRLLHRLEIRLSAVHRAVRILVMRFWIEPGDEHILDVNATRPASSKRWVQQKIRMARATRSSDTLFSVIREQLGGRLPGGIWALRLDVEESEVNQGAQLDLFSRRDQTLEDLGALVGRLSAALGDSVVFSPVLVNTYRPETAWRKNKFSVDAACSASNVSRRSQSGRHLSRRPALESLPLVPHRPVSLLLCPEPAIYVRHRRVVRWRGRYLGIRALRGHEQFRTEWWQPDGRKLNRDYVQVETEEGTHLWMYLTPDGEAFIHGIFD